MKITNKQYEKAINMYLNGATYTDIAKYLGYSRTYITRLIKNDPRIVEKQNKNTVKVIKNINSNRINVSIKTAFWQKLGISLNQNIEDYVDLRFDEKNKELIIKKHEE